MTLQAPSHAWHLASPEEQDAVERFVDAARIPPERVEALMRVAAERGGVGHENEVRLGRLALP